MKMVTEPPRSNQKRSATPAAGSPRRAAQGAQPQPGARKRNPAVKPATPKQGKAGAQGQGAQRATRPSSRGAQTSGNPTQSAARTQTPRASGAKPAAAQGKTARQGANPPRPSRGSQPKAAPKQPADTGRKASILSRGTGGLNTIRKHLQPTALMGWIKRQVGSAKQPNWRGIATIALAVIAVVMLLYGGIVQSRKVSQAQALEGFQARVITAVVVSHGFSGTKVDVNGENVAVAQMDEPVPVGQPVRVRINPNSPGYVVDARIDPADAIATAKRNRLFAVLFALIAGAGAAYLVISGRGNR